MSESYMEMVTTFDNCYSIPLACVQKCFENAGSKIGPRVWSKFVVSACLEEAKYTNSMKKLPITNHVNNGKFWYIIIIQLCWCVLKFV